MRRYILATRISHRAAASVAVTALAMTFAACGPSSTGGGSDGGPDGGLDDGTVRLDVYPPGWFTDDDGDGYSEYQGDCDDTDPLVAPFVEEICDDGIDNNCNGAVDEQEPDGDGDGFGPCQGDCDDTNPDVHPAAIEVEDGIDNNCDGIVDGDYDGDGFTEEDGDCDDHDPRVYPGAVEDCYDGVDNDCNGYVDFDEPDMDGDGYGPCEGDCDEGNPDVHPGAPEIPGDGIDNNCDNLIDKDIDGDGWTVENGDCDDLDPNVNPSVFEDCTDGIDNNCDGLVDQGCISPCMLAELTRSNVGCEYFAVDMDNENSVAGGCYAVIVSNPDQVNSATVRIQRLVGGSPQDLDFPGHGTSRTIAPGGLEVFRISGSCSPPGAAISTDAGIDGTGLQVGGAFRIVSDFPVIAYQINPFEAANLHTTDASLLLPWPALDRYYYVVSYPQTNPARGSWDLRGAMNIVGVHDNTQVTITASTNTRAGGPVPALSPGQVWSTTINAFDNLQIETSTTDHDLSGTYVEASEPVAVFSGNECADVPKNYGYCDHLEEQLTPLTTWGTHYVGARHPPRASENVLWRLVAAVDNTTIQFDPAVHADYVLNAGQVVEFATGQDFLAYSPDPDKPFFMVQIMQGAEKTAQESGTTINALGNLRGDPAMTLSVPTAQYLDRYVFLSDPTYAYNWLVVVRSDPSDTIHLDCFDPIPDNRFSTVGAGPFQVARITLSAESGGADGSCTSGAHEIWGDGPFGIWVFGVYADTSYGYPGGMNLQRIYTVY